MLIDAHAHLDHYDDVRRTTALAQIADQRIFTISVAMDPPSYARAKQIAADSNRPDLIVPTFGVHPWEAHKWAERLDELDPLIAESPMLGEIGLDTVWVEASTLPAQRRVLEHFLAAARAQHKIVNLHSKGAEHEVAELLRAYQIERAIVHWYSGGRPALRELIALDCYFTVGVEITRSNKIRTIAQLIPEDKLLTETDNPGGWEWLTEGEPGMPTLIAEVVATLAEVRGTTPDAIRKTVHANLLRLFADDPHLSAVTDRLRAEPDAPQEK